MGIGVGASGWVAMGLVGCTINYLECHCTMAMGNVPHGYNMVPKWCVAMGIGGCTIQLLDVHGKVAMVNLACWVYVWVPLGVML